MVDVSSISALVAAVGMMVGVAFAILELRNLVITRQTDLVMRLHSTFGNREHMEAYQKIMAIEVKDYDEFIENFPSGTQKSRIVTTACAFYEGVGVLLHRKLIDVSLVDDLFSTPITWAWEKMKPIVEDNLNVLKYGSDLNTPTVK